MDGKSLGVDRLELGSLSGDSQEFIGDLPHAGKTSYLRSQLNADDFKLVKRGSRVLRSCAVCLSNAGVEESHVGFVTGGQGIAGNGQSSMQQVVFQTWCGENSTHPLSSIVASTRRGTTTDCGYSAFGKRPSSRCRDQGGHPEDTMRRLLGMFGLAKGEGRAKQALNMAGRQAEA